MNNSIEQAQIFVVFILVGAIIGIFFDCFRILRKTLKTSDIITALEDGMFWILTGLFLIYMIFVFNNGEIRLFLILGVFIGLILYFITISKIFVRLTLIFIETCIKYFFLPLIKILHFLIKPFKKIFSFLKKKVIVCFIHMKKAQKLSNTDLKERKFTFFSKKTTKKEGI